MLMLSVDGLVSDGCVEGVLNEGICFVYASDDEVAGGIMFLGCLSVCFLCNPLSNWHKFFTMYATIHEDCFNDNYVVIGPVVWQPSWKNGKTLDFCISETTPWKFFFFKPSETRRALGRAHTAAT